jgi:cytochrome c-type biogenesis protein CcmH/NrfG
MWILITALVILAAAYLVTRPLWGRREPWVLQTKESIRDLLDREKERVFRTLKDLEEEKEAGAIGEEEYRELYESFRVEAALINRRYEELLVDPRETPPKEHEQGEATADESPEKAGALGEESNR